MKNTPNHFNSDNEAINDYLKRKLTKDRYCEGEIRDLFGKEEISKKDLITKLHEATPRERLIGKEAREELCQTLEDHSFYAQGTNTIDVYKDKIRDTTVKNPLTQKEYQTIMNEIKQHNSILPTTNKRDWYYGGGGGDVILSTTTGKIYSVDDNDSRDEFLEDYNGKQYYRSRSGLSGAGYAYAGKKSLLYLPTFRTDVADPQINDSTINGVNISIPSIRGVTDEEYPAIIKHETGEDIDFTLVDLKDTKDIENIIVSQMQCSMGEYTLFEQNFGKYIKNSKGEKEDIIITYRAKQKIDPKKLKNITEWSGHFAEKKQELEETGSEFERVLGIYKLHGEYVTKGNFGLAKDMYTENPRYNVGSKTGDQKDHFEYIVGDGGILTKQYYDQNGKDIEPKNTIRGWTMLDANTAYRKDPKNDGKYIMMINMSHASTLGVTNTISAKIQNSKVGSSDGGSVLNGSTTHYSGSGHDVLVIKDLSKEDVEDTRLSPLPTQVHESIQEKYEYSISMIFSDSMEKLNNPSEEEEEHHTTSRRRKKRDMPRIMIKQTTAKEPHQKDMNNKTDNINKHFEGRDIQPHDGGHLITTRYGNKIYVGYCIMNTTLNKKFDGLSTYQDYEEAMSYSDFLSLGKQAIASHMKNKAYEKSIARYTNSLRRDTEQAKRKTTQYLQSHPKKQFFLQDSYAVDNCEPGTLGFMDRFNIQEGITAEELLKHPEYNRMLNEGNFRTVFLTKYIADETSQ